MKHESTIDHELIKQDQADSLWEAQYSKAREEFGHVTPFIAELMSGTSSDKHDAFWEYIQDLDPEYITDLAKSLTELAFKQRPLAKAHEILLPHANEFMEQYVRNQCGGE